MDGRRVEEMWRWNGTSTPEGQLGGQQGLPQLQGPITNVGINRDGERSLGDSGMRVE